MLSPVLRTLLTVRTRICQVLVRCVAQVPDSHILFLNIIARVETDVSWYIPENIVFFGRVPRPFDLAELPNLRPRIMIGAPRSFVAVAALLFGAAEALDLREPLGKEDAGGEQPTGSVEDSGLDDEKLDAVENGVGLRPRRGF